MYRVNTDYKWIVKEVTYFRYLVTCKETYNISVPGIFLAFYFSNLHFLRFSNVFGWIYTLKIHTLWQKQELWVLPTFSGRGPKSSQHPSGSSLCPASLCLRNLAVLGAGCWVLVVPPPVFLASCSLAHFFACLSCIRFFSICNTW